MSAEQCFCVDSTQVCGSENLTNKLIEHAYTMFRNRAEKGLVKVCPTNNRNVMIEKQKKVQINLMVIHRTQQLCKLPLK